MLWTASEIKQQTPAARPEGSGQLRRVARQEGRPVDNVAPTAADYRADAPRRRDSLGKALPFRQAPLDPGTGERLRGAPPGATVDVPLVPGVGFRVLITGRWDDGDGTRIAGRLEGHPAEDRFFLSCYPGGLRGRVELASRNLAYEIEGLGDAGPVVREWLLTDVICATPKPESGGAERGMPPPAIPAARAPRALSSQAPVPELNSRPGATGVLYLDFDGETVSGTYWAGGATIVAAPANLTASQMAEVWERVSRDYEIFDVNVTTSRAVYDAAPGTRRTHCIITSTDTASPGAGGVALFDTFWKNNNAEKICWSFIDYDTKFCAEIVAHEIGHTFNLSHDGRTASGGSAREEYYEGHGSGATGWAPIMGVGYYQNLTQWSRGEYTRANNPEDDIAIIAARIPVLADDHGSTRAVAVAVAGSLVEGMLGARTDADYFGVTLPAGTHSIRLAPVSHGNVDLELTVENASGSVLATANPSELLDATATFTLAGGQAVFLRVDGIGKPTPTTTGYSDYGSLGRYSLTGFGNQQQAPSAPAGLAAQVLSGSVIRLTWTANPAATSYSVYRNGSLLGTATDTSFLDLGGTPSTTYSYAVVAANSYGTSPASASAAATTVAADQFIMDGAPDFAGYRIANPGMTIHAAIRGTKLYIATWSPGDNNSGSGNDHFILISDTLLPSATTAAPWAKLGFMAIPAGKPFLAGESSNTFAGWNNASGPTVFAKAAENWRALEGVIDLASAFGTVPAEIYVAAVAYQTDNATVNPPGSGRLSAQAPAGNGNTDLEPSEFLRIPLRSVVDTRLNGIYDVLAADRAFRPVIAAGAGSPSLMWPSVPERTYEVWTTADLAAGGWTNLTPAGLVAGPAQWSMGYSDGGAAGAGVRFYRVMAR